MQDWQVQFTPTVSLIERLRAQVRGDVARVPLVRAMPLSVYDQNRLVLRTLHEVFLNDYIAFDDGHTITMDENEVFLLPWSSIRPAGDLQARHVPACYRALVKSLCIEGSRRLLPEILALLFQPCVAWCGPQESNFYPTSSVVLDAAEKPGVVLAQCFQAGELLVAARQMEPVGLELWRTTAEAPRWFPAATLLSSSGTLSGRPTEVPARKP
jgi:hypothetical protein